LDGSITKADGSELTNPNEESDFVDEDGTI